MTCEFTNIHGFINDGFCADDEHIYYTREAEEIDRWFDHDLSDLISTHVLEVLDTIGVYHQTSKKSVTCSLQLKVSLMVM